MVHVYPQQSSLLVYFLNHRPVSLELPLGKQIKPYCLEQNARSIHTTDENTKSDGKATSATKVTFVNQNYKNVTV